MDFTATLQQNGATVASTTNSASFHVDDGWCFGEFKLTASAGGGAGVVTVLPSGLPMPLGNSWGLSLGDGGFLYFDASVGRYVGAVRVESSGLLSFRVDNSTTDLGSTPTFTVASTDELHCTFRYPVS